MRIAVVGAGGVGGYSGAALARAGHDVVLFARGEHLAAIRARGLTVRDRGAESTASVSATDRPEELGPADLAIVAVKSYSIPDVAPVVARLAAGGADVLPLLNGVEAFESLAERGVAPERMLAGLTGVSLARAAPGVIERHSDFWMVVVGERRGPVSERAERIAEAFRQAGASARASAEMEVELWQKFLFLAALAAACGLARASIGAVREAPYGRELLDRAVREIGAVARARGVALPSGAEEKVLGRMGELGPAIKPSFLLDLERGGPNELEVLSGAVSRMGREAGVATPIHDTASAALSASLLR